MLFCRAAYADFARLNFQLCYVLQKPNFGLYYEINELTKITYEILNGKRPLSLAMIRRLHDKLGIPADVLIQA